MAAGEQLLKVASVWDVLLWWTRQGSCERTIGARLGGHRSGSNGPLGARAVEVEVKQRKVVDAQPATSKPPAC